MSPSLRLRSILLLAALQLAAGPLVLVGVLTLGKVAVKEVARHGLVHGLARAAQSDDWQAACDLVLSTDDGDAQKKAPGGKAKEKLSKCKLINVAWAMPSPGDSPPCREAPSGAEPARLSAVWPNGPPVPPPRAA